MHRVSGCSAPPECRQFSAPFRELQTKGIDGVQLKVQFKNFPLSIHPNAQVAHQAAMAAREQGKFWDMHDVLFANQSAVRREDPALYGAAVRLFGTFTAARNAAKIPWKRARKPA